ncbi:hypothetical protein [Pseudomonas sp.]|uniref:hypothetical protein n=1 Tax=Pseudomonas sp. TaxID=306 RepID=UPI003FD8AD98
MAGDWIKMRLDLQTHPKVVRILSATKADKFRVVGGLHAVWSVFDTHSSDGRLYGYSPETLDHIIGWEGFANAMISVGWLDTDGPEALILPEFDEHNGKSGKRRAEDQKRKREDRKSPQSVRNLSSEITDEKLTREEKRREEVLNPLVPSVADDIPRPGKPECPHQEIIKIYHEVLPQCPTVRDWTPARATQLRARWNESPDRQNLDYWRGLFQYVAGCDFLVGRTSKPFFADLEFITKSNNFTKIREGKYENR